MLIIGIDIGTTGAKALVVNDKGETLGIGYNGYPLITGNGSIVEQDAKKWYESTCIAVRQATKNLDTVAISALSLSTQGASSLLVDADFNPLTNAITWMDGRSTKEKQEIIEALGDNYIYQTTGWKTNHSLDACKLLWIKKNLPDIYKKASHFVSTIDFMNYHLTGVNAIDPTNSSIRQLMNIRTLKYDEKLLSFLDVDKSKLSPILPTGSFLNTLTPLSAKDLGLSENVRVYNGAHDQYCGLYGANIIENGELLLSTGTAWATIGITNEPYYTNSYISPGPHVIKGKFGAIASLPVAGASLDWLLGKIISDDYSHINANINSRMYNCTDLLFYPYLSGSTFPLWDENMKGAYLGLTLNHDKYDLALACMEGIVFQTIMAIAEYPKVKAIKVMGGAILSPTWMNILAALCDCDLYIMNNKDIPSVGAALIAAVGEGLDYDFLVNKISNNKKLTTTKEIKQHYATKFILYKDTLKKLLEI